MNAVGCALSMIPWKNFKKEKENNTSSVNPWLSLLLRSRGNNNINSQNSFNWDVRNYRCQQCCRRGWCFHFAFTFSYFLAVHEWIMLTFVVYLLLSLNRVQLVQICTVTTGWRTNLDRLGLPLRFWHVLTASYWDIKWRQISANESSSLAQVPVQQNSGCGNLANFMLWPNVSSSKSYFHCMYATLASSRGARAGFKPRHPGALTIRPKGNSHWSRGQGAWSI